MHNMMPTPMMPTVFPTWGDNPPGWRRVGLPKPSGVLPPPGAFVEARELGLVRRMNANRSPQAVQFTEYLAERGGYGIWQDFAKQYRHQAGFLRGWMGTALMNVALGVTALHTQTAKRHYDRLRPYQIDGSITPIGKLPKDKSYPSGHASSSAAAATVLGALWPARAYEFKWWAEQVALSRVHGGVHFPSDVRTGAVLGTKIGVQTAALLY